MNVPKCPDLNSYVPAPGYTPRDYMLMELTLLDTFGWNICLPTPAHFTDYFLLRMMQDMDREEGKEGNCGALCTNASPVMKYLAKYVTYFLEISMQGA